jgi:hypothetical protein
MKNANGVIPPADEIAEALRSLIERGLITVQLSDGNVCFVLSADVIAERYQPENAPQGGASNM